MDHNGELFKYDLCSSAVTTIRHDGMRLLTEKLVAQPCRQIVAIGEFDASRTRPSRPQSCRSPGLRRVI